MTDHLPTIDPAGLVATLGPLLLGSLLLVLFASVLRGDVWPPRQLASFRAVRESARRTDGAARDPDSERS